MIPAKEFEGELWIKASDYHQAIKEAQRQPLTEDEIEILAVKHAPPIHPDFAEDDDFIEFARAIERAHGIKEKSA